MEKTDHLSSIQKYRYNFKKANKLYHNCPTFKNFFPI